ncbi:lactonase family protein [Mucilaginibacter sp. UYCu711]|uniref:lactonase family protein n=1 Tax=Mucilaginibacter sp. UYCu711 TaxID=3156339 RepID=UPI003D1C2D54
MKKLLLVLSLFLSLYCKAQTAGSKIYDLVVGTRTHGASDGIYVYRFDPETGKIIYLNHIDGIADPTYLCISNNKKFVYAVSDKATGSGGVYAYKFDAATGKLDSINNQPAYGGPLYVSVDKAQKNLFAANYLGGVLSVYPINADGSLGAASQVIQDIGSSINRLRQEGPHVHTAFLSPDEKYLLYTDLGTDKLNIYKYNPAGSLVLTPGPVPFVSGNPGYGPRHIDMSANGKFIYMLQELTGTVTVYRFNRSRPVELQIKSMVVDNFRGNIQAADIHLSPDGRFLYTSNRGSANEIIQFSVNKATGLLTFVKRYSSMGRSPRNFVIDPTGNYLFVSNQYSNNVAVYKINKRTGRLTLTPSVINIDAPMCIRFVPVG